MTLLSKALAYYPLIPGYDFRTWHQMCIEFLFLVLVLAQIFSPFFGFPLPIELMEYHSLVALLLNSI